LLRERQPNAADKVELLALMEATQQERREWMLAKATEKAVTMKLDRNIQQVKSHAKF